ncbi:uncharacterized protein LOC125033692 [Penaeus chinensis]|uniref:uncharacterized protein LOC125033692 n=1 Tax=Penaeus chinensis TaxID=139456 RepID=UPI001FB825C0|nr:uncharacterized protein LOC125033692 [Penaeus chinensis]
MAETGAAEVGNSRTESWREMVREVWSVLVAASTVTWIAAVLGMLRVTEAHANTVTYTFTQFPYKESVANEKLWSEYEVACAQSPRCLELRGVQHTRCVRQCVSPSCYLDIYTHDELEEGEIDVRLSSFKGCFLQRMSGHRRP